MKKILLLSGLLLLSLWMVSCKDSLEDSTFATATEQPVGIYLDGQPEYSEWVKLLRRTNLFNALNISATKFTCFVADNEAIQAYLQEKGYATVDDIPLADAIYLVRYHIIPGNAYAHSSFSGQILDTTASGDYLTVKYRDGGINAMYVNDVSLIIRKDIQALNGYIHKIDKLLDPITESVWDLIAQQNDRYSIFQEALQLCGLEEWLKTRNKTVNEISIRDYKTIFIVSNETFQAAGINSLEDLKNRFPSQDYTSEDSDLRQFLMYHIINSYSDFAQLAEFDKDATVKTKNYETMATNQLLSVEDLNKKLVINRYADSVLLVPDRYDQQANNGYLHEVDDIMPIATPRPAKLIWEFTDIEDCRILAEYRKPVADQTRYAIDRENAVDIEWFTVPDKPTAVQYNRRVSWTNDDLLWVSLGNVGWVKVRTPVIVKGTYKITIRKFQWGTRGKTQLYIDDEKIGPVLNFSGGGGENVVLGNKTFPENGRHWVKMVSLKAGDTEVDQLTFEPVN